MSKTFLQKHRSDFNSFIESLKNKDLPEDHALEDEAIETLQKKHLDIGEVEKIYAQRPHKSYINAFRTYLEESHPKLPYRDVLRVIEESVRPRFEKDYINYSSAIRAYLRNKHSETLEAIAEWRAYFESRFYGAIDRFFSNELPKHKITLNILLWSFQGKQILPVNRMDINLKPDAPSDKLLFDRRKEDFEKLGRLSSEYSFVWDIVNNNITTIFYFDKVEGKSQMTVYEIDSGVEPGKGDVNARYAGKITFSTEHRNPEHTEIVNSEDVKENPKGVFETFQEVRTNNEAERSYQYQAIRFFIRSGIFDPKRAASAQVASEPEFSNLLENAPQKFKEIIEDQYNTSTGKATSKKEDESDEQYEARLEKLRQRRNAFKHNDKYSASEDRDLDEVIAYIDSSKPEAINTRIAIFEAGFFYLTKDDESKISDIYWMPLLLNWRDRHVGGTVFINTDRRITISDDDKKAGKGIEKGHPVNQKIINIFLNLTGLFADKLIGEIEESIRPAQERAAAVSIMSRNISHNIGSHVLSYLKNLLSNEYQMLKEKVFEELILINDDGTLSIKEDLRDGKNENYHLNKDRLLLPYLRSIGRLIGYFQERQDYIGTFASDRYLYFSPLYFKESVIDYFCGETRAISADGDLIKNTRNLALDFIIYSEGYRQSDIEVNVFWSKGRTIPPIPLTEEIDIEVALPSGNTGRQGIYTILENFIRNSAKHGVSKEQRSGNKMSITLTLSDAGSDYYKVELSDNSGNTTQKIKGRIQSVLKSPLISKEGTPDEQHKGIKEIQIAAAWLRGIQPHDLLIEPAPDDLPILSAERISSGENGNLQYTFYLRKPKVGLLVVKDKSRYYQLDEELKLELKEAFLQPLSNWDIQEYRNPRLLNPEKIPYRFVVIHKEIEEWASSEWKSHYLEIYRRSPARVLTGCTDEQLQSQYLQEDLYRTWLNVASPFDPNQTESRFSLVLPNSEKSRNISGDPNNPSDSDIRIGIEDPKKSPTFASEDSHEGQNIRKFVVVDNPPNTYARQQPILFREHNDLPLKFAQFRKAAKASQVKGSSELSQYLFIEGITGDNSTNRIFRHDTISHLWRYRMLEAALTKIIIIDERIWKNYYADTPEEREQTYLLWEKKNIHILSLEYDLKSSENLCLIDLRGETVGEVNRKGMASFKPEYKAHYEETHFISLHQGLLERAVKHAAGNFPGKTDQEQVTELFRGFKDHLLKAKFRVLIHSGRSKTHILPYPTAFVQLSSLGSALRDCKLSLCELFYSTIQEESQDK